MKKVIYHDVVIETTRRCNMQCAHCMRGEAQNKDISLETIDRFLDTTEHIDILTLTGGEIALNVNAIEHLVEELDRRKIPLGSFYAVTNGKEVTPEFMAAMIKLYMQTEDFDEMNGLALSKDEFHEPIPPRNEMLLKAFSFFRGEDKECNFTGAGKRQVALINLGRARELSSSIYKKREPIDTTFDAEDNGETIVIDSIVTVTVDGEILNGCDYEYASTDEIKLGNVYDKEWAEKALLRRDIA